MLFNSWQFLFFFPVVTCGYFLIPHPYRWAFLLFASAIFYMAAIPWYVVILAILILVDYACGIWIEEADPRRKKAYLTVSILSTCLALFIFKYFNFFIASIQQVAQLLNISYAAPLLKIVLPIGLSFHTFQSLSYVIEVYKGRQKAERHLGIYALYVMFYPQLVAGPIERTETLLPQLKIKHSFDYERMADGLKLMLWGFVKKLVIADRLSILVDSVYHDPQAAAGWPLVVATLFFSVQIYCDFSGYTDIAIGAASVMGFNLMENFRRPYLAKSPSDFWRRWHISLSTWFRDYIYIPLGGSRVTSQRLVFNVFIVFLVSGLWHGASWTFMIWGLLHGILYLMDRLTLRKREKLWIKGKIPQCARCLLGWSATMASVTLAWVFFRAESLGKAVLIVQNLFSPTTFQGWNKEVLGLGEKEFVVAIGLIVLLFSVMLFQEFFGGVRRNTRHWPKPLRWALSYVLIIMLVLLGEFQSKTFIYFQF